MVVSNAPADGSFPSTVQREADIALVDEEASALILKARKLMRFSYIPAYDELLVKYVRKHDAHKAGFGIKMEAFESVRSSILKRIPLRILYTRDTATTYSI